MSKQGKVKVNFYANLRQAAGQKSVDFPFPGQITMRELIGEMIRSYPRLEPELIDNQGDLHEHLNIVVDGRDIRYLEGHFDYLLENGHQVSVFPAFSGGDKRYNGIDFALT